MRLLLLSAHFNFRPLLVMHIRLFGLTFSLASVANAATHLNNLSRPSAKHICACKAEANLSRPELWGVPHCQPGGGHLDGNSLG